MATRKVGELGDEHGSALTPEFAVSLGIGNCGMDCGDRCAAGLAAPP